MSGISKHLSITPEAMKLADKRKQNNPKLSVLAACQESARDCVVQMGALSQSARISAVQDSKGHIDEAVKKMEERCTGGENMLYEKISEVDQHWRNKLDGIVN